LLTEESILKNIVENEAIKEAGKIILASVFVAGTFVVSLIAPGAFCGIAKMFISKNGKNKREKQRAGMMQAIYNLRNRKLIEWDRDGDKVILKITPQGRSRFVASYIQNLKIRKMGKWDKIWRISTFDVPNNKNSERDLLRYRLKKMGFYQFQKSAFITPFSCRNEIEAILEYYNLFDYVTYFEAKYISGEERCKNYFGIR
jgi:hypothetical protein